MTRPAPPREMMAAEYQGRQTEAEWQAVVVDLAQHYGWHVEHVRNMLGNTAGMCDLLLWRGDQYLLIELKSERGVVSPKQERWIAKLAAVGATVHVLRPSEFDRAEVLLREKRQ